jgi:hypothetical protein
MIIISHRGNTSGSIEEFENRPDLISDLLDKNIDCEIDVWYLNDKFYLGHDFPKYEVDKSYILQKGLWCHAKNLESLYAMSDCDVVNFFWHQEDDFTLTSQNIIWTYPNKKTTKKSIIVDTSNNWRDKGYDCLGVCVDWI